MQNTAYVALGTNQGHREEFLRQAIKMLDFQPQITIQDCSSIYETEPVGYLDQPKFLNMVLKVATFLQPLELLNVLQKIEEDLGRIRSIRWGPRTIDLDILLFNNENIKSERLIVPHPRMFERSFVIKPLLEVYEDLLKIYEINTDVVANDSGIRMYTSRDNVYHWW
ncbi:2-amino-4-hydroxy-6-hydroxymethyldihydropteridine diphosphokinase [Calidifontibacillus oryziterrae]|uniref:2-amino-4-hydroxy-6- hydroxymethyldihydropteridine diphosphokinase n=1 Tax=Calidifontibacillus oryziterrae TaxID=1191699 RepID=UPI0003128131|nr:2-amino-4-hydroxy-6-hydroxymethyldihydropteridine diphosphokinase [Calidifontibacillus oryziterrae]